MSSKEKIKLVKDAIHDLVSHFAYYDRKEDEDLSREDIEYLIENKLINIDFMVNEFRNKLEEELK